MTGRRRRGYTLIEMVLVIGALTIVLGLCTTVLSGLIRLQRGGQAALTDASTLARLARQFRQDVRAAEAAKRTDGKSGPGVELAGGGGAAVVYRAEGRRLVREVRAGETVKARESYAAGRFGPVDFGVEGGWVRLTALRRPERGPTIERGRVTVEARLGKDRAPAAGTGGEQ